MKLILPVAVALLLAGCGAKQPDAREIFKRSAAACQAVQNGTYTMTRYMKYMSEKDTMVAAFSCAFERLKADTLFPSKFYYSVMEDGKLGAHILYTGNEFVHAYTHDSSATVMANKKWAQDIINIRHNFSFYEPFTHGKLDPANDSTSNLRMVGEELFQQVPVWHVQINPLIPAEDRKEGMLREEYHYWIRQSDFLPVQYARAVDIVDNKDTMYQYEKIRLDSSSINSLKNQDAFSLTALPAFYKIRDYMPDAGFLPLPNDTLAPAWELTSTAHEKVSLNSLKGKLVLVDFFYKGCHPCMQALPALQSLSEKYKDKGFKLVGIDPVDTEKEDDISAFLKKRGVTYTVLLNGEETAKKYRVYGYPTTYLIGKTGRILFSQAGYGPDSDAALDELIRKNL